MAFTTSIKTSIRSVEELRNHLQTAIELEHATIPTYLCALFTIKEGTNLAAYDVIRSVVVEEMLHMTLACNVMNAVGGCPAINKTKFVAQYPTYLPHSSNEFKVHLRKFSPAAITTFMEIEQPSEPHAPPEADNYHSIGQFYKGIQAGMEFLVHRDGEDAVFTGHDGDFRQVPPDYYYGGGEVIEVFNLESAKAAMEVIVEEGEGLSDSIWDEDYELFGQKPTVAHYFRFFEIMQGRFYKYPDDSIHTGPTGEPMDVVWDAVYNMKTDPKLSDYPPGSEIRRQAEIFNQAYFEFLTTLHYAFNGRPDLLIPATGNMFDLKRLAMELIKNPLPGDESKNAGPTFERPV
jgi:hypothetical protein